MKVSSIKILRYAILCAAIPRQKLFTCLPFCFGPKTKWTKRRRRCKIKLGGKLREIKFGAKFIWNKIGVTSSRRSAEPKIIVCVNPTAQKKDSGARAARRTRWKSTERTSSRAESAQRSTIIDSVRYSRRAQCGAQNNRLCQPHRPKKG